MNSPRPPRCTLAQFVPEQMDVEAVKAEGWRDHRILVVNPNDQRLTWMESQVIEQIGKRLYPERKERNGLHR